MTESVHLVAREFKFTAEARVRDQHHRMTDRQGRLFRCDAILTWWFARGDDPLVLTNIQVRGAAILKNGDIGKSERFTWFEPHSVSRITFGPPLSEAPKWVREFVRDSRPDGRTVANSATCE